MDGMTGIQRAVLAAGGQRALAERLRSTIDGYDCPSQQAISLWVRRGYVPNSRVAEIAAATGIDPQSLLAPELRQALAATSADK